jgi:hypothetical protein
MQYDGTLYENLSMHNVQLLYLCFNSFNAYEKNDRNHKHNLV